MNFENRKVISFLDNVTCHPEFLQNGLTNIKLVILGKNTDTSSVNDNRGSSYLLSDIKAANSLEECYS